jgi:hypothetical protein
MDLTPIQQLFLKEYTDPKSEYFGNAYQSAIKAGYSEDYAKNITGQMPEWLSENLGNSKLLLKARKNLEIGLDGLLDDPEKGGKPIQAKLTEFTLKNVDRATFGDKADINLKGSLNISFDSAFNDK